MKQIIFYGLILTFFFSCENSIQEIEMYSSDIDVNKEIGTNVEITFTENGILQVKLYAPTLIKFEGEDAYMEMPNQVELKFFNGNGTVSSELTADYGINFEKRKTMKAVGNVVLQNRKGEKLNAEELNWDQNNKRIYSDKFVKITTENDTLMGDGFESNEDFSEYKILKPKGESSINKDDLLN